VPRQERLPGFLHSLIDFYPARGKKSMMAQEMDSRYANCAEVKTALEEARRKVQRMIDAPTRRGRVAKRAVVGGLVLATGLTAAFYLGRRQPVEKPHVPTHIEQPAPEPKGVELWHNEWMESSDKPLAAARMKLEGGGFPSPEIYLGLGGDDFLFDVPPADDVTDGLAGTQWAQPEMQKYRSIINNAARRVKVKVGDGTKVGVNPWLFYARMETVGGLVTKKAPLTKKELGNCMGWVGAPATFEEQVKAHANAIEGNLTRLQSRYLDRGKDASVNIYEGEGEQKQPYGLETTKNPAKRFLYYLMRVFNYSGSPKTPWLDLHRAVQVHDHFIDVWAGKGRISDLSFGMPNFELLMDGAREKIEKMRGPKKKTGAAGNGRKKTARLDPKNWRKVLAKGRRQGPLPHKRGFHPRE